jgi:hypothetical protein
MNRHCAARARSRSAAVAVQFWATSSDFQMASFVSVDWSICKRLSAVTLPACGWAWLILQPRCW